jgi:hypothetical protein
LLQQNPSVQKPLWHCVASVQAVPFTTWHAPAPLQLAPPAQSLSGSVLTATLPHVPSTPEPFFAALHAWQMPPQIVPQQTPSTQKPDWHSTAAPHAVPVTSVVQRPAPLQVVAPEHSLSGSAPLGISVHVPFAPPLFALLHAWQRLPHALLQQKPSAQWPDRHSPFKRHTPPCVVLQAPPPLHTEVAPGHSRSPGSVPEARNVHVPVLAGRLHASQVPAQALLQHTPSVQKPLAHSLPAAHTAPPRLFVTHAPALQNALDAQSASPAHITLHAVAPHA